MTRSWSAKANPRMYARSRPTCHRWENGMTDVESTGCAVSSVWPNTTGIRWPLQRCKRAIPASCIAETYHRIGCDIGTWEPDHPARPLVRAGECPLRWVVGGGAAVVLGGRESLLRGEGRQLDGRVVPWSRPRRCQ